MRITTSLHGIRSALRLVLFFVAALSWYSGIGLIPANVFALDFEDTRHLVLRAGFGPEPFVTSQMKDMSRQQAVAWLLSVDGTLLPPPDCIVDTSPPQSERKTWDEKQRNNYLRMARNCTDELKKSYVEKLLVSRALLRERMTLFWHNHFTSSAVKVRNTALMYHQHRMLYSNALEDFRVMLHSVVHDPAMLGYLDNVTNESEKPNENLARELFELFTLGEGQYTERDVKEAARALTGQSVDWEGYGARFYPLRHDFGEKEILGEKGHFGPEGLVELILRQPQTARFIARKVWLEFISTADERQIKRLAQDFARDWNIGRLVEGVLLSDQFWRDQGKMIKSPVELLVGTERLLPGQRFPIDSTPLLLDRLGQPLFAPVNVKGWPTGLDWVNSSRMMLRINVGERLVRGLEQESSAEDMAFICQDTGPRRLATMPPLMDAGETDESCLAVLEILLVDPVWQLK